VIVVSYCALSSSFTTSMSMSIFFYDAFIYTSIIT
jgi:hypothetical protein